MTQQEGDGRMESQVFDELGGRFEARLRRVFPSTRSTKSGDREIVVTNFVSAIEAKFDFATLDRLHEPNFLAIERPTNGKLTYLIFEVVGVNPMHFQMLGMDVSMPTVLRKEYLDTISQSWGRSQETWIDVSAVPTWYLMSLSEGGPSFEKSRLLPLAGATVHLLSKKTVENFLCYDGGEKVGTMIGFEMPLTINLENLVRYHGGIFGYTGSGKSNLTSSLIRKAMRSFDDITVVVFDVAGEYVTHLVDIVEGAGRIYTDEAIETSEQLMASQVIPESLEISVGDGPVREAFSRVFAKRLVTRLSLSERSSELNLSAVETELHKIAEEGKGGSAVARIALESLTTRLYGGDGLQGSTGFDELSETSRKTLIEILQSVRDKSHGMSALRLDMDAFIEYLETGRGAAPSDARHDLKDLSPEGLADRLAEGGAPRLNVLYLPDPLRARMVASSLTRRLLYRRKKALSRKRILIVLDEAQEYIPDNPRERDYTFQSNQQVEQLLRQGRKYRVHCWLATQRVAHLNVSALQQLHSYFVSTLPRFYDRMVIADSFALPYEVLERSSQLDTGEWIFVSYKASRQKGVPVFVRTSNNEIAVETFLKNQNQGE